MTRANIGGSSRIGRLRDFSSTNAGSSNPLRSPFEPRSVEDFQALRRPERELLLALWEHTGGVPYEGGYAGLIKPLKRSLRTLERLIPALVANGFIVEQKRAIGETALVCLHPQTGRFAVAERIAPSRPRYVRALPARQKLFLASSTAAVRCARVRRPNGSRYVPTAYLADMLSEREKAVCFQAVATGVAPICEGRELSNDLLAFFADRAARERFAASERARGAIARLNQLNSNDLPHFVEDAA